MKILYIAPVDSVTTARWVNQLCGTGWQVHLFPVRWPCKVHPALQGVILQGVDVWRQSQVHSTVTLAAEWPFAHGGYRMQKVLDTLSLSSRDRVTRLYQTIKRLKPDIVHTLEMQGAGYLALSVRQQFGAAFPRWIYSCWGSDIYLFGSRSEHQTRIKGVLACCDYLFADCNRDIALAREWGFKGVSLGVFPGGGGLDVTRMRSLGVQCPVSQRRVIAVKGYHEDNCGGRALVALQALCAVARLLIGYEVIVYSATEPVRVAVHRIQQECLFSCRLLPHSSHDDMLRLMGSARIALAVGLSDGTPNALLEAMTMGAFPVQSDTISTREWITHGVNGFLVDPRDAVGISACLETALRDDMLVDGAEAPNLSLMRTRCDVSVVRPAVLAAYERSANGSIKCQS